MAARETRDTIVAVRVNPTEEREFRLVARAEQTSTSEAIRRAMRERAEKLARGKTSSPEEETAPPWVATAS